MDSEIASLFTYALPVDELGKLPTGYFVKGGVVMRKWRPADVPPSEDWSVVNQVVVR